MITNSPIIREIEPGDNPQIAQLIRAVLEEHNITAVGTTYTDVGLDSLFEYYDVPRAIYYVVELNKKVIGGGGIIALEGYEGNICELQKMYFLKEARGHGLGKKMLELCLDRAKEFNYESCYLETMPHMKKALALYEKYGFQYLNSSMGKTGHYSCNVWMLKKLSKAD